MTHCRLCGGDKPCCITCKEGQGVNTSSPRSMTFRAVVAGVILGACLAGVLVSGQASRSVSAHLNPWGHTWPYSFTTSNCGWNTEVDPVQVVYYNNASYSTVQGHSAHHGWASNDGTTAQQYFDNHGCGVMTGQNSSAGITSSRYHQRYRVTNGDSTWGTYAISTPHYEDIIFCGITPKHAVRENHSSSMPEGGFINAKHKVNQLWHNYGGGGVANPHHWNGAQNWDNVRRFQQCDGEWAWGNGLVDFIRID
jgi:hypothetical protein